MTSTRNIVLKRFTYVALLNAGVAGACASVMYAKTNPLSVLGFFDSLALAVWGLVGLLLTLDT